MNAKKTASATFIHFSLINFLRKTPRFTFTKIKRAPRQPQTIPIMIAAGRSSSEFSSSLSLPNFKAA